MIRKPYWHARTTLNVTVLLGGFSAPLLSMQQVEPQASSPLQVSVVTVGPGARLWERFGHNAIRIRDATTGYDRAFNYGMFSFQSENFLARFIRGRMRYWIRASDAQSHLQGYVLDDRTIWIQDLDLTDEQKTELRDFLEWNARPENAFYDYNYYFDNCSTRVRDALDRVLGGTIEAQTGSRPAHSTFRFHTQRLMAAAPLVYTGLLIGLGNPVDRPISQWEEMFLPMKLRDHLRKVTVVHEDGRRAPLVRAERVLYESTQPAAASGPPRWLLWYLLLGAAIAGLVIAGTRAVCGSQTARFFVAALVFGLSALVGVLGVTLVFLWALTDHVTSYWNENLFMFNPLSLLLALAVAGIVVRRRWSYRAAAVLAISVAAVAAVGFVIQVVPRVDQVNGQLYALLLLPQLAAAYAVWVLALGDHDTTANPGREADSGAPPYVPPSPSRALARGEPTP